MKFIITNQTITMKHISKITIATLGMLVVFFAVLPFVSNVQENTQGVSLTASFAAAQWDDYFGDYGFSGGDYVDVACCDSYFDNYGNGGGDAISYQDTYTDSYFDNYGNGGGNLFDTFYYENESDYLSNYGNGGGDAISYQDTYTDSYFDNYGNGGGSLFDTYYYENESNYFNDYGFSGGDVVSYEDTYTDSYFDDYGFSGGDVIDNGCCDDQVFYDDYFDDYGFSGGDVIDNGCCDDQIAYEDTWYNDEVYYDDVIYDYYTPSYTYYDDYYYEEVYAYNPPTYSYNPPTYNPPTYNEPDPTCTLDVSPRTIDDNDNATLTWTTHNATNVTISSLGSVARSGSRTVSPNNSTTYTLIATGPGGSTSCTRTITVEDEEDNNDNNLRCELNVRPSTVDDGEYVTLEWNTTDADDVDINNGVGDVSDDGSRRVRVTRDTTFTLTARNGNDTVTCQDTVDVQEENDNDNLRCDITVRPSSVEEDDYVTIEWNTTDADDVDINNGIGDVSDDGSRRVRVDEDTTFILTARNGNDTVTCRDSVNVDEEDDDDNLRCDITVRPSTVDDGDYVTVEWNTTDADDVDINNGVGDVSDDGTKRVRVTSDKTFILTARNGNDTVTCRDSVNVDEDDNDDNLRCSLRASDKDIKSGDKVTLSWTNKETDRIVLRDSHGKTIADSDDDRKIDEDKDSLTVKPTKDTKYTLTAYDGSDRDTCTVDIDVDGENDVTVSGTRTRDPLTTTVSLTQVPYTGFDAGPFLTTVFYALIVLWGLVMAYVLVIKRRTGGEVALATQKVVAPAPMRTVAPVASVGVMTAPMNLPVVNPVHEVMVADSIDSDTASMNALEAHAQDARVLISSDALRFIIAQSTSDAERMEMLNNIIVTAKAAYPKEDGWVVVNKERILALLA